MIKYYGFIVKALNYDYKVDRKLLDTDLFKTEIIGVSNDDDAINAAKEMINRGVEVIELCGGFGKESSESIISKLDTNVPIGYVIFTETEHHKLMKFLS